MNNFDVFVYKSIGFFLIRLPRRWLHWLGCCLGILWFDILRIRRRDILDHLKIFFPDWTEQQRISVGRKSLCHFGRQIFELFIIPWIDEKWIQKNFSIRGIEHLHKALEKNKGVFFLANHIGNGDLTSSCLSVQGYRIHLISKIFKSVRLNSLWFGLRAQKGVGLIEAHGDKTAFQILRALKNNECVAFVLDQFMGKPFGIETEFAGRLTGTAYGLALFHLKTKSPVIPVTAYVDEGLHQYVEFFPELLMDGEKDLDRNAYLKTATELFNKQIERTIRQHPEQWMWLHRRWKTFE